MEKIKKHFWLIITTVFMVLALAGLFYINRSKLSEDNAKVPFCFKIDNGETVNVWKQDKDNFFVFLPSYAESNSVTLKNTRAGNTVSINSQPVFEGDTIENFEFNTPYNLIINGQNPKTITFMHSENVATMYVETFTGCMDYIHADKEHKERAKITLYTADGELDYSGDFNDQIRGRGNSTWKLDKKPYNLYLSGRKALLEMDEGSEYVLLANSIDSTNLRNKLVCDFARSIQRYDNFAPDCEFVDLYLNGEYNGLYLLSEKITADKYQIQDDGFLCVLEHASVENRENCFFVINLGVAVEIKYPLMCSESQKNVIEKKFGDFQTYLLVNDDGWKDYIDIDSWARKYLIEEIFVNIDSGVASEYYCCFNNSSFIYAGPCWDYDYTLGCYLLNNPKCFVAKREWKDENYYTPWYHFLMEKSEFKEYVLNLYQNEFLPMLTTLCSLTIDDESTAILSSAKMNSSRWNQVGQEESVAEMKEFLQERIEFLNSAWIDGVDYKTITLTGINVGSDNGMYRFYCTPINTICEDLPSPEFFGVNETVWYYEGTDIPFDYNTVITEDIVLYAKQAQNSGAKRLSKLSVAVALAISGLFIIVVFIDFKRQRGIKK